MTKSLLHVGLVDFADPTLLLIGDEQSFAWLAERIGAREEVDFSQQPNFARQVNVKVRIAPCAHSGCLRRKAEVFDWEISTEEAQQLVGQLRELAASVCPAHAYLDPESNVAGVQVVASKGEYDPSNVLSEGPHL